MPRITLTNLTAAPLLVQELYTTLPAGGIVELTRDSAAAMSLPAIVDLVASGVLKFETAYTDNEIATGFTPYPGIGATAPIATIADAANINTTSLADGTLLYVAEVQDLYVLDRGAHTPNGTSVLSATGGGFWVSRQEGRWDDVQGSVSEGVGGGALTYEAFRDTPFRMYFLGSTQNDELHFRYQMPHSWLAGSQVRPHLHILPMADPAADEDVYFEGYYVWTHTDSVAVPALSGWFSWSKTLTVSPGDVYIQKIVDLGLITPPAWAKASTILLIFVTRLGTDARDTYSSVKDHGTVTANVGLLSADVHYQSARLGSILEIP